MEEINRILVVSWMSEACRKSVHYGVSLAGKYQADLLVVHIINTIWLEGWAVPKISMIEERKRENERERNELADCIDKEREKGVNIREVVREGNPVEEIMKIIDEEKIDLLVTRAQQEGRVEHFLISGSNDAIIRKMPCSIFLVKDEPEPVPY